MQIHEKLYSDISQKIDDPKERDRENKIKTISLSKKNSLHQR